MYPSRAYTSEEIKAQIQLTNALEQAIASTPTVADYVSFIDEVRRKNKSIFHPGILLRAAYCYFVNRYLKFSEISNERAFIEYFRGATPDKYTTIFLPALENLKDFLILIDPTEDACPTLTKISSKISSKITKEDLLNYKKNFFNSNMQLIFLAKRKNNYRADPGALVLWTFLIAFLNCLLLIDVRASTSINEIKFNQPLSGFLPPQPPFCTESEYETVIRFYSDISFQLYQGGLCLRGE